MLMLACLIVAVVNETIVERLRIDDVDESSLPVVNASNFRAVLTPSGDVAVWILGTALAVSRDMVDETKAETIELDSVCEVCADGFVEDIEILLEVFSVDEAFQNVGEVEFGMIVVLVEKDSGAAVKVARVAVER